MSQKVKLLKDHTHAGVSFPKGATLTVDNHDADWLIENKAAAKYDAPALTAQAPASAGNSTTDSKA